MMERLAIDGGERAVRDDLPTFLKAAGRTFGGEEERLVIEALRSGCLSRNGGTMVCRFEEEFASMLGVRHALACSSGTAAVHLAVAALDLEPGDEVIVPPITDMGSILPVLWQNALPVFADVDEQTMVLDPVDVARKITPRTKAIIAVHLAGQPCDVAALRAIAAPRGIALIEDCSQAYWAVYQESLVGTLGDLACFSLQQSKHITCGEGGLMVTSRDDYARRARLFSDKAWPRDATTLGACRFLFLSQNYRMGELQGAVALAQLPKLKNIVQQRRDRAAQLTALLDEVPEVRPPYVPPGTVHSYWLYMLRVNGGDTGIDARRFGDALVAEGVPAWVQYIIDPLYLSPLFTERKTYGSSGYPLAPCGWQEFKRGLCPNAERSLSRVIAILWNENLTHDHVRQIAAAIEKCVWNLSRAIASR